jgi:predicted permease
MFRKKRADGDFAEEIRSHLELEADELQAEGVSRDEAERRAHVAFGNVATAREQFRLRRRWAWLASISQDLRFAIRKLRKSPGFAAVAIATLALGIGANAVVFSVLNALVLTPLNVPRAQSLYMVQQVVHGQSLPSQSYPDYLDLRDRNQSFQSLAACAVVGAVGLNTGGGNPSVVWPYLVSGNYFRVLGVHPYLGRFFGPSDVHGQNSAPYIVLAYDYWKSHFHADPAAVGRIVQVNKHPYTILGVAPPGFRGTLLFFAPDFFAPIMDMPQIGSFTTNYNPLDDRSDPLAWVVGHLKPRVTPGQATADLNTLAASLARSYPKTDTGLTFSLARPGLAGDTLGRPARAFLAGLMLLAGLILLAACANLGSLFAARASDRSREIAMRVALGSRRRRVVRQLLTETVLIGLLGGALGLCLGIALAHALSAWYPVPDIPINLPVHPGATPSSRKPICTWADTAAIPRRWKSASSPPRLGYQASRRRVTRIACRSPPAAAAAPPRSIATAQPNIAPPIPSPRRRISMSLRIIFERPGPRFWLAAT